VEKFLKIGRQEMASIFFGKKNNVILHETHRRNRSI